MAVHVGADDVHLVGPGGPDFGAVDLRALSRCGRLAIELAQLGIRLRVGIGVHAGPPRDAAVARAARSGSHFTARNDRILRLLPAPATPSAFLRRRRVVLIRHSLGRTAIALELRLDPIAGLAIALGALAAIAKLRQTLDGGLVFLEFEASYQGRMGSFGWAAGVAGCCPKGSSPPA